MRESTAKLILCDDPTARLEEFLPFLRQSGFECQYVPSAADLTAGGPDPDVVLIGGGIRGGARGECFTRITSLCPGIPLIVLADMRSLSVAVDFFRAGASDYLALPVTDAELLDRIDAALRLPCDTPVVPCDSIPDESNPEAMETETPATARDAVLDALPCGVLLFDRDGRLTVANPAALALFGVHSTPDLADMLERRLQEYAPVDLMNRPVSPEIWPPRRALRLAASAAATVGLRRPDGTRIWLRIEAKPVLENGTVVEVAASLSEISSECAELQRLRANPAETGGIVRHR